jgi:hypothetical protein
VELSRGGHERSANLRIIAEIQTYLVQIRSSKDVVRSIVKEMLIASLAIGVHGLLAQLRATVS